MLDNVALLVVGYDPYKDVWDDFFLLLNKYWKKRPKTYLATNTLTPSYAGVTTIPCGEDAEWSKKVQTALRDIEEKYIVLLLEDFFMTRSVNSNTFSELMKVIENNDIDYCKLLNQSKIKGISFDNKPYLHVIEKKDVYGISLQPAIWNRFFLMELVGTKNYNAWVFEFNQMNNRCQNIDRINCIADDRNILEITHMVVQSVYLRSAIRVFKRQGFMVNTSHIKPMSFSKEVKYRAKQFFSEYMPESFKPFAKDIGRLLKIDYVSDRQKVD